MEHLQKIAIGLSGEPVPPTMRSGAAANRNSQRPLRLALPREVLELQVVEQVDAHRVERQDVDREATPSVVLGAVSLLPSEPERGDAPLGEERHGGRVQPRLGVARVPRRELGEAPRVAGPDQQDVARPTRHALLALGRLEVLEEHVLPGLEPRHPAQPGHVEQHAAPDQAVPERPRSRPRTRPRAVTEPLGFPL